MPDFADKFSVSLKQPTVKPLSFRREMCRFASGIRSATEKPIAILLSGGLDSEVLARSFIEADVKFEAFTCEFSRLLNAHDTSYAYKFCLQNNIKHTVLNIDPVEFIKAQYALPKKDQLAGIAVALIYNLSRKLTDKGYFVLSSQGSEFRIEKGEMSFMADNDRLHYLLGGNYTNFTTSEILHAVALDPIVQNNYDNNMDKARALELRNMMYRHHYPELEIRPKYDGWEYIPQAIEYGIYAYNEKLLNQRFAINYEECVEKLRKLSL